MNSHRVIFDHLHPDDGRLATGWRPSFAVYRVVKMTLLASPEAELLCPAVTAEL
jgi:hypothetical protein